MTGQRPEVTALLDDARRLTRAGHTGRAVACLRRAVTLAPEDPVPLERLARLSGWLGDWSTSRACLERLVALRPGDPETRALLGAAFHGEMRFPDAAAAYRSALELDPDSADALSGLARVRLVTGHPDEAQDLFQRALDARPGHHDAAVGLAGLHENRGDADRAMALIGPMVRRGVADVELARVFAGCALQLGRPEPAIGYLEQLLPRAAAAPQRAALLFSLAGLYQAAGRVESAFRAADEANRLVRGGFDPDAHRRQVDALVAAPVAAFRGGEATGARRAPLVFIVGVPRSGTTLVEQILAQHPAVLAAGEHSRLEAMAERLQAGAGVPWQEALADCTDDALARMAERYLEPLGEIGPDIRRITDKMPVNLVYLGLAARVFPAARVIWCRRDPLDVGLSCYMQSFGGRGVEFANDLSHIGCYIRDSERLMAHWRDRLALAFHELSYEALVARPEDEARRLLSFLGLEWDEGCLRFHESRRFISTPSYAQVRRPIHGGAVGRHRDFARYLQPLRDALEGRGAG